MRAAGDLRAELQRDALVGLEREHELVGFDPEGAILGEGEVGDGLQRDRDLGDLAREALAGAQVEGDAGPAPVVDFQAQRRKRLRGRALAHAVLFEISRDVLAAGVPGGVLRARGDLGDLVGLGRMDRVQDLDLLVADFLGGEAHRGLHCDVAEQLEHVVLDQVAQRPGLVVEAGAGTDPDVLGGSDLDGVDVVAVPQRLEHAVGEAKRHHVLDRLLAQVVVDAEDLRLLEHVEHLAVELERLLQ